MSGPARERAEPLSDHQRAGTRSVQVGLPMTQVGGSAEGDPPSGVRLPRDQGFEQTPP
jgi:hypothetical protein